MQSNKINLHKKIIYHYTAIFEREPDGGGYHVFCPALKGCHSQGDTYEEAVDNIKEAILLYLESMHAHGETPPQEELLIQPMQIEA
ncbi:MAG: type II toxin-antitoxin system HicB family antitoxin [bacterium]